MRHFFPPFGIALGTAVIIVVNCFFLPMSFSQVMVKDIYPGPSHTNSNPYNLVDVNGTLFFKATDYTHGIELWKTDGRAEGTTLIKDICSTSIFGVNPGALGPNTKSDLTAVDGTIYFTAIDCAYGYHLWKSDGTEAGTMKVMTNYPDSVVKSPVNMTDVDGTLFFTTTSGGFSNGLWKSDGTASGTMFLKDIRRGNHSSYESFTGVNGTLYFVGSDGITGKELWKSDGTAEGTVMVKNIHPENPNLDWNAFSGPPNFTALNGNLYFIANDGSSNGNLWKSDGTESGTVMVKDIPAISIVNANGTLFVGVVRTVPELWKSDGTAEGTVMVKENVSVDPKTFTVANGLVFFVGYDETHGSELWRSDGTSDGTMMVKDINPGTGLRPTTNIQYLTAFQGSMYFSADDGSNGAELWKSDGTEGGTVMVRDLNAGCATFCGSNPSHLKVAQNTMYFAANDGASGIELWKLSGTTSVRELSSETPQSFSLGQNYPNPFNPSTTIVFQIPRAAHTTLSVYSILGERLSVIFDGELHAGTYSAVWDANGVAGGVYFYRLQSESYTETKKLLLVK